MKLLLNGLKGKGLVPPAVARVGSFDDSAVYQLSMFCFVQRESVAGPCFSRLRRSDRKSLCSLSLLELTCAYSPKNDVVMTVQLVGLDWLGPWISAMVTLMSELKKYIFVFVFTRMWNFVNMLLKWLNTLHTFCLYKMFSNTIFQTVRSAFFKLNA